MTFRSSPLRGLAIVLTAPILAGLCWVVASLVAGAPPFTGRLAWQVGGVAIGVLIGYGFHLWRLRGRSTFVSLRPEGISGDHPC